MGMRQPARLSTVPAYGVPEARTNERSRASTGVLPLLLLVVGLAVATVWYVGLPALEATPRAERSCEVIVLRSGTTKCVSDPTRGSRAAQHASTGRRAKH